MMWGTEIGKRLAEKRMRDTADFSEGYSVYIGTASTLHTVYIIVGRQA